MYDKIRGQLYEPRKTETQSLGHSHVLPPDLRSNIGAYQVLTRLTQKAAMRLRKQGFYATAMSVQVRCMKRPTDIANAAARLGSRQEARFNETQDSAFFLHTLGALWARILQSQLLEQAKPLSVGMVFYGLVPAAQHTPSLFDAPVAANRQPKAELMRSIDTLNAKYGKNTLHYAVTRRTRPCANAYCVYADT